MKVSHLGNGAPPGGYAGAAGWRAVKRVLRSYTADLATVFLPAECRLCGAPLLEPGPVGVCATCVAAVSPAPSDTPTCTRCGDYLGMESARFAASFGITECTACRLAPPAFTRAVASGNYDSQMRELLHLLKFGGQHRIAPHLLATRLATAILQLQPVAANDLLVVPVPLFAARQRERGFNQAELLAASVLRSLKRTTPAWHLTLRSDLLLRIKDTRALHSLDPAQRRRNLRGAFQVDPTRTAALARREVLLIDDILTTGATARACAGVLLRAGASKVWVATAAKAQPPSTQLFAAPQSAEVALWTAPARTRVIEPDIGRRTTF
jgi:ComF family protein